jgi:hypothetical protein
MVPPVPYKRSKVGNITSLLEGISVQFIFQLDSKPKRLKQLNSRSR